MTPWRKHPKTKPYPKLGKNLNVDVAIIGGGITGILCAYRLIKSGKKVALVEKKTLGTYATMDTTAFITKVIDSDLSQIASNWSDKTAKAVWESGQTAVEEYDRIIREENIDCEFMRCSNFVFASTRKQFAALKKEHELYMKFKIKADIEERGSDLRFNNFGYMEVPDQAKFHVTKFLYTIAEKTVSEGLQIFENTPGKNISGDGPVAIETPHASITAKDVIIATYKPLVNKRTHLKKGMYRSYVFELSVPAGTFREGLYEDMSNPYYYFRVDRQGDHDRVIIGGEDHKDIFGKTLVNKSFKALNEYVDELMSGRPYMIVSKWNGPVLEPSDGLPLIGEIKPHYYVATGFSGNGMTYAMISSMIFYDLLLGRRNAWEDVYTPKRALLHPKRLASKAKDYVEEFFAGAVKNALS